MLLINFWKKMALDLHRQFLSPRFMKIAQPRPGKAIHNRFAIVFHRDYMINLYGLECMHPFDTDRYGFIYSKLIDNRLLKAEEVFVPEAASDADLSLIHYEGYLESLKDSAKVAECLESFLMDLLPAQWAARVVKAFRHATGGTILAAQLALQYGVAITLGGGFHHAKPGFGEGFCLFADIPIAIKKLKTSTALKKVLIIDLDVHQGNGNIVSLYEDFDTYIFSMHQRHIYPSPKEIGDWDIELDEGTSDKDYLKQLKDNLPQLFENSKPELVFYIAGCDPLQGDPLASLALTPNGIIERDLMVVQACLKRHIPLVITLAGGYSKLAGTVQYQSIRSLLERHSTI